MPKAKVKKVEVKTGTSMGNAKMPSLKDKINSSAAVVPKEKKPSTPRAKKAAVVPAEKK